MKKLIYLILFTTLRVFAQSPSGNYPPLKTFTAEQDHQNMMEQLGIKTLRHGPSGNDADANHANYDESKANPCPVLPEVLTLKNGKKVTTPDAWWKMRRPELVEDLEREMYGKLPANLPSVTWEVKYTDHEYIGFTPVIAKQLVGHVDNSACPLISVDIEMTLVLPANPKVPVPLLMMFGQAKVPAASQPNPAEMDELNGALKKLLVQQDTALQKVFDQHPAYQMLTAANPFASFFVPPTATGPVDQPGIAGVNIDPPSVNQLIANGWGCVYINPASIQADNGAALTRGIIGLVNKGQPRKPDDWGALRAWAWGAARGLDYLEKNEPQVDVKHVGIEGVSRYGKAALVTMAFEPRFAMGLIGSSGEGGAKISRRNWGEAVESLTGSGEYHWMAGNFMKYGAADGTFGSKTPCDLPVDSHDLIALCAPRLIFISYGIPEKGDAKWLDHQGSYMATIAAGTVYKLLGAKDLGVSNDYTAEKMPPVNTPLLDGQLAWRQHDQGHQDQANMKWFLKWADKNIGWK